MFSRIFSHRAGAFARKALPLFVILCFVTGAALFSGCDQSGADDPGGSISALIGDWASDFDSYSITDTELIYTDTYGYGFKGLIRYVDNFTADSGVIIVEYTTPPAAYTPPGNFQGVYYKELTEATVKLGSAYTVSDQFPAPPVEVESLDAAKEKFKLDNIALYGGELTAAATQQRKQ